MSDLQALLDQIDRLDQEATKGPWDAERGCNTQSGWFHGTVRDQNSGESLASDVTNQDAEFIALARTVLPQLAQLGRNLLEIRDNAQQQADDINGGDALDITKLSVLTEVVRSINRAIEHAMETNQ